LPELTYIVVAAMLLVGVALFVTAPLYGQPDQLASERLDARRERLEHDRAQAVHGLRDLELDHQMNKLSRADYEQLRARLEERALRALAALEQLNSATTDRSWTLTEDCAPATRLHTSPKTPGKSAASAIESSAGNATTAQTPILLLPDEEVSSRTPIITEPAEFARQAPTPPLAASQSMLRAAFCPGCGVRLNTWAKFCSGCGTRISAAQ
jgi:hypothetical protein